MSYRTILPLPPKLAEEPPTDTTFAKPQLPASKVAARGQRHNDEEWNQHKPLILQLYYGHTVNEMIDILKREAGFQCGVRRLREKIAEWNLPQKKLDESNVKFALAKEGKRKREEGLETRFIVDGIRIEEPRMKNLQKRHPAWVNAHLSPSAPTPEGLEYYTPRNLIGTPAALTSPAQTPQGNVQPPETSTLSSLTDTSRTVLEVRKTKYPKRAEEKGPRHLHPFHQSAYTAAIGSGRFRKHERLIRCLWAILPIVKSVPSIFSEIEGTRPTLDQGSNPASAPQYSTNLSTANTDLKYDLDAVITLLKAEVLFQNLLSLDKHDAIRWQGPWHAADQLKANTIQSKADAFFGDPCLAYQGSNILKIVVSFQRSEEPKEELLLRVTTCSDPREYVQDCGICEADLVSVDIASSEGTLTIQYSAFDTDIVGDWKLIDTFKTGNTFRSYESPITHFDLVRSLQGWTNSPIYAKCRCGRKEHFHDHTSHKIDVVREKSEDVWDIEASAYQDAAYQQFPLDDLWDHSCVTFRNKPDGESSDDDNFDNDADVWDPDGDGNGVDQFDLSPSQDEEHSTNSLPTWRTYGYARLFTERVEAHRRAKHNEAPKQ